MESSAHFNPVALDRFAEQGDRQVKSHLVHLIADSWSSHTPKKETEVAITDILLKLLPTVSRGMRVYMAEKLSRVSWVPRRLMVFLAKDVLNVACSVLENYACFEEEDFKHIIQNTGVEHHRLIAMRPDCPADLYQDFIQVCEERNSGESASHPHKTEVIQTGSSDMRNDTKPFAFLKEYKDLYEEKTMTQHDDLQPDSREAAAERLVEKYRRAKVLHGSWAVRALKNNDIILFEHAMAAIAVQKLSHFRSAMEHDPARALALACRAASLTPEVYPVLFSSLRRLGSIKSMITKEVMEEAAHVFKEHNRDSARMALRDMAMTV